jgi:hypothetical protein
MATGQANAERLLKEFQLHFLQNHTNSQYAFILAFVELLPHPEQALADLLTMQ